MCDKVLTHILCVLSEINTLRCLIVCLTNTAVLITFKGIVHPKMKILSVITHLHVVPTP